MIAVPGYWVSMLYVRDNRYSHFGLDSGADISWLAKEGVAFELGDLWLNAVFYTGPFVGAGDDGLLITGSIGAQEETGWSVDVLGLTFYVEFVVLEVVCQLTGLFRYPVDDLHYL